MDQNGYPCYFQPNDGRTFDVNSRICDNRHVVPFSPILCSKFNCHINVKCAVSIASIKYTFRYVYKGPDRASLKVEQKNKVRRFIDGQYISAPDAAWRIFLFETHKQVPNVVRLQVCAPQTNAPRCHH